MKIKWMRYHRKKVFLGLFLFLLLLGVGVGYALVTTKLAIDGTVKLKSDARWDIHFTNFQGMTGSVSPTVAPTIGDTSITFSAKLDNPSDFYGFTVDVINQGTINAELANVTITPDFSQVNYIESTIAYNDDTPISSGDLLLAGKTNTLKVLFKYKDGIDESLYPTTTQNFNVTVSLHYQQYTGKVFAVGDYFTLVPDSSTYTILATDSGYDTDQTIVPSDLTLWRVIDVKDDGTYDAVSEYVSSTDVNFKGVTGYAKYVKTLQDIAAQYAKTNYTVGTRMFGYGGQTLEINDTSIFDGTYNPNDNPDVLPPATATTVTPTTGTGEEFSGGVLGDTLYLKDYQLVGSVYSTDTATYGSTGLKAYNKTGEEKTYWAASRRYSYSSATEFTFDGRAVADVGELRNVSISGFVDTWHYYNYGMPIRPIITLKSGIEVSGGKGTKTNSYILK